VLFVGLRARRRVSVNVAVCAGTAFEEHIEEDEGKRVG
jgi:hypothetical protein